MVDSELAKLRDQILALSERYAELAHGAKPFVAGSSTVPPSGKVLGAQEMRFLVDSCLDFWLTTGRFNAEFELLLAKATGTRRTLTTNSGSSANLLAMTALTSDVLGDKALKPGDEVITCATGFPTTVNPIIQNGLIPVFLDVEMGTYNIDVTRLESAVSPRTRAIMIAHALGNPFDLDAVTNFARKHDLFLIEDCCDALGATYCAGRSLPWRRTTFPDWIRWLSGHATPNRSERRKQCVSPMVTSTVSTPWWCVRSIPMGQGCGRTTGACSRMCCPTRPPGATSCSTATAGHGGPIAISPMRCGDFSI
jgi:DegT/DnrJ/EryC1/StrS aminotransferase family